MEIEVTFSNPGFQKSLWSHRNDFCDATIVCNNGKNRFGCHKIVLATVSNVLRDLLQETDEIDLGEVSSEDAHLFLKFIYLGKIRMRRQDNEAMIKLGQKYNIKDCRK